MFYYHQSTGQFFQDGVQLATGHAGNGDGLNNPAFQGIHNKGPLPRGVYKIAMESADKKLGIVAMRLDPDSANIMFGRSGFYIHAPEFSEGCIVLDLGTRCKVAEAVRKGQDRLTVVE